MKCAICNKKIQTTFLNKMTGTWLKNNKGKKKPVCSQCQKKYSLEELRKKI